MKIKNIWIIGLLLLMLAGTATAIDPIVINNGSIPLTYVTHFNTSARSTSNDGDIQNISMTSTYNNGYVTYITANLSNLNIDFNTSGYKYIQIRGFTDVDVDTQNFIFEKVVTSTGNVNNGGGWYNFHNTSNVTALSSDLTNKGILYTIRMSFRPGIEGNHSVSFDWIAITDTTTLLNDTFEDQTTSSTPTPNIASSTTNYVHVNATESWQFQSNLTGTVQWSMNKTGLSNTTDLFNWTIPAKSTLASENIWKIEANNDTNYTSWYVSSLNTSEAPEIVGDFSDMLYTSRTELDPWGRALPDYTSLVNTPDVIRGYLNGTQNTNQQLRTPSTIKYGTWIFYYRFPSGGNNNYADNIDITWGDGIVAGTDNFYRWQKPADEHIWGQIFHSGTNIDYPVTYRNFNTRGSGFGCISDGTDCEGADDVGIGSGWHKVIIINDKRTGFNFFWMGNNSKGNPNSVFPESSYFVPEAMEWLDDVMPAPQYLYQTVFEDNSAPYSIQDLDVIAVFNETYLYPPKLINVTLTNISLIGGLNISDPWTLSEIATDVNNASLFSYNSSSRTAIINANLSFDYGTGFDMSNETLIFNTISDGQYKWTWRSGIWMNITNSNIHAVNGYYFTLNSFLTETIRSRSTSKSSGYINIIGSNISNVQGFGLGGRTYLDHFNFSNNYILIDKTSGNGIFNFNDQYGYDFVIRNNTYDVVSDAPNKESTYWMQSEPITMYDYDSMWLNQFGTYAYGASKSLVNNNITGSAFSSFGSGYIEYKYYVDINVTTSSGSPVSNATVIIHNMNISDGDTVQNMTLPINHWSWINSVGGTDNFNRIISTTANNNHNFTTGVDGHTVLPGFERNTIILASYKQNQTIRENYTYNISVSADGYITNSSVVIIPDSSWYRPHPDSYQNTTNIILTSSNASNTTTIIVPSNSWGMFSNWTTTNQTFSQIAANISNDVAYSYYNVSSGEWEHFYVGYSYNSANIINNQSSVMAFFNAPTTLTLSTVTPSNTNLETGWNMLYVEGTSNTTLSAIQTNIEASPCSVSDRYRYNSTTNAYSNLASESLQPNEGFLVYIASDCTWTRTTI